MLACAIMPAPVAQEVFAIQWERLKEGKRSASYKGRNRRFFHFHALMDTVLGVIMVRSHDFRAVYDLYAAYNPGRSCVFPFRLLFSKSFESVRACCDDTLRGKPNQLATSRRIRVPGCRLGLRGGSIRWVHLLLLVNISTSSWRRPPLGETWRARVKDWDAHTRRKAYRGADKVSCLIAGGSRRWRGRGSG